MAKVIRCPYCGDMLSAEDTITSDWFLLRQSFWYLSTL